MDNLHNTAGDVALSLNDETCYKIIRDAGIRSGMTSVVFPDPLITTCILILELLLSLLSTRQVPSESPLSLVLKATDETPAGSTDAFLSSRLRFTQDEHGQDICLLALENDEVGVMMGWERDISVSAISVIVFVSLIGSCVCKCLRRWRSFAQTIPISTTG